MREFLIFMWNNFEGLMKRAIMPSSFFFFLVFIIDTTLNSSEVFNNFKSLFDDKPEIITYGASIILVLSIGYAMQFSVQFIFDNWIKGNFNTKISIFGDGCCFDDLRKKVIDKLKKDNTKLKDILENIEKNKNDYILYQEIGSIYKLNENDTKKYTDNAKIGGVLVISIISVLIWYMFVSQNYLYSIIFIIISYIVGFVYVKSRYRARAYRIYINVLNDIYEKRR